MRQMDLTEGVIWKKLLVYAWPVVLSSLLQSAYAITDLVVAGWFVGKDGISAINNASQVTFLMTQVIIGLTTGGNILMGQYYGSRDGVNRIKTNRTLFLFSVSAGGVVCVLLALFSQPILMAIRAPALAQAEAYLQICALGMIPVFGYNALAAMLRSVGNSKQPFYCVAVTAGCNIALDILFMGLPRLPEMHVHIHQPGSTAKAGRLQNRTAIGGKAVADSGYPVAVDPDVSRSIHTAGRIQHPGAAYENPFLRHIRSASPVPCF